MLKRRSAIAAGPALAAAPACTVVAQGARQVGIEQGAETPRFFLIQGGQITFTAVGNNAWRDVMWPTLLDVNNSQP